MKWVLTILVCVSGDCHTIEADFPTMEKCVEMAYAMSAMAAKTPETSSAAQEISCKWKDKK
jgi:hypothetical protein